VEGLRLRVDRRSVHPAEEGETGVTEALVRGCRLTDEELASLKKRCGQEVVYWTTEADNGLFDFWIEDEHDDIHGPFACTGLQERKVAYTLAEVQLRFALLESCVARYYECYSNENRARGAAEAALREVESELQNDLGRAKVKRAFLEDAGRDGVERLAGMAEAFQIALNRIQTHKPR